MTMFVTDSYMLRYKKTTRKGPTTEDFARGSRQEEEIDTPGAVHDNTSRLLEKGGASLKWGEVLQMFKKQNFPMEAKDQNDFKVLKTSEDNDCIG
jgi:hypothetical protein